MDGSLDWLLKPMTPADFAAAYRERSWFHLERGADYYSGLLTLEGVDALLSRECLPSRSVRVVRDGVDEPSTRWSSEAGDAVKPGPLVDALQEGRTLVLQSVQRFVPAVNLLCGVVMQRLELMAWVNLYVTPARAAGFLRHSDPHDVLILQIAGEKRWEVFAPDGVSEVWMRPGDLLYLPAGLDHSARSESSLSAHLTLGIEADYGNRLLASLAELMEGDEELRRPYPLPFDLDAEKAAFESAFRDRLTSLSRRFSFSALRERRFERLVQYQPESRRGRVLELATISGLTLESVARTRLGVLFRVSSKAGKTVLTLFERRLELPKFVLEENIPLLRSRAPFRVGELRGLLSPEGKVELAASLVRVGLIEILASGGSPAPPPE